MITEETLIRKSKQTGNAGSQSQIRTTSALSNPKISNTETTENVHTFNVTRISLPFSSTLIPGIKTPLQVLTKTVQSNSDIHKDPNVPEMFAFQNIATSHQFHSNLLQHYHFRNLIELNG